MFVRRPYTDKHPQKQLENISQQSNKAMPLTYVWLLRK